MIGEKEKEKCCGDKREKFENWRDVEGKWKEFDEYRKAGRGWGD